MSKPASLKVGPFTSNVLVKKRYLLFYIFLFWISVFTIQFEFWIYYKLLINDAILFIFLLPLLIIIMYISIVVISLIFAKILIWGVNFIHKPRVGTFLRDKMDKDYRYWSIRNTIKKWPIWLSHKFPFPFLDNLCFKMFGVKTKFSNSLFEGWVDTEFIEMGKNVTIGEGSIVQSALIAGDLFIIRKTKIEDKVIIGSHSIVMPGTKIGENCILAASSVTTVGQELEPGWIYLGVPAKKFKKNRFYEDNLEYLIGDSEDIESLKEKYDLVYVKRKDKEKLPKKN
ncbi:MAG: DapH/DapD/GlmU-related protein [Promethearchaeati archaeon]